MIFEINETSKVDFSIVIAGTQMRPTEVRVVLGDKVKLVFPASSDDGVNYSALVTPLKDIVSSVCLFTIEVLFGNKIFVPIRRQITINDSSFVIQIVDSNLQPEVPAYVEPEVVAPVEPEVVAPVEPEVVAPVEPEVVAPTIVKLNKPLEQKPVTEKVEKPKTSIFETVTKEKKSETQSSKIKTLKTRSAPQVLPPITLPPMQLPTFDKARKALAENKIVTKPKIEKRRATNIEVDKIKVTKAILAEKDTTAVVPKKTENKPKITENINNAVSFKREEIVYI